MKRLCSCQFCSSFRSMLCINKRDINDNIVFQQKSCRTDSCQENISMGNTGPAIPLFFYSYGILQQEKWWALMYTNHLSHLNRCHNEYNKVTNNKCHSQQQTKHGDLPGWQEVVSHDMSTVVKTVYGNRKCPLCIHNVVIIMGHLE